MYINVPTWANSQAFGTTPVALGAQSALAYIRIDASNAAGIYYILSRVTSGSTTGLRWFFTDNTAQPLISLGFDSTGTAGAPNVTNTTITHKYGKWFAIAYSHDGSLTAANIKMYSNSLGSGNGGYNAPLAVVANSTTSNGTTAFANDSAKNFWIGDREGGARGFTGGIGYVAMWNRVMSLAELEQARISGPLTVQNGLVMCYSDYHDYGPYGLVGNSTGAAQVVQLYTDNPGFVTLQNRRRSYTLGKAPANFTGSPTAGSLVKTGAAPTLLRPFADHPAAGSLVKTGAAPTLLRPFADHPAAGSLAKTGAAPTLRRNFADTPVAGGITKTGGTLTLVQTNTAPTTATSDAGAAHRARRRQFLEIDGLLYEVTSREQAQALLRAARDRLKQAAKVAVKQPVRAVATYQPSGRLEPALEIPQVSAPDGAEWLQRLAQRFLLDAADIQAQALRVRAAMERDCDDEEVLLLAA